VGSGWGETTFRHSAFKETRKQPTEDRKYDGGEIQGWFPKPGNKAALKKRWSRREAGRTVRIDQIHRKLRIFQEGMAARVGEIFGHKRYFSAEGGHQIRKRGVIREGAIGKVGAHHLPVKKQKKKQSLRSQTSSLI